MARGKGKNPGSPLVDLLAEDEEFFGPGNWTDRQRLFVRAYMRHRNSSRAVREAGFGCHPENAGKVGWKLLNDPAFKHVQDAIAEREAAIKQRLAMDEARVLEELRKVATFSLADVFDIQEDGTARLNLAHADADQLAALSEVQIEQHEIRGEEGENVTLKTTIKIKAHSKLDALEKLGKNLKLFTDKMELNGSLDIGSALQAARRRARLRNTSADMSDETDGK
ncbi:terminase small subunit [Microvirga mediterraneensis]|uniref:Terminase small subunit n=1 Tax=Microvirga mediterraneensis TaxID=2754695 RepID=A0A838BVS5_9HYPH|nr:terminase small subunit [Microvirga mediterraneensis]MBA1159370.1 terminase small subunit [Microvirga mediterraneensis]